MSLNVKYIGSVKGVSHLWQIDDKKIKLSYFGPKDAKVLHDFTSTIQHRIASGQMLFHKCDYKKTSRFNAINAVEIASVVFPTIFKGYLSHVIDSLIAENLDFTKTAISSRISEIGITHADVRAVNYITLLQNMLIEKMKELGYFKFAFRCDSDTVINTQFVKPDGYSKVNYTTWLINDKKVEVAWILPQDADMLSQICYEIYNRLENKMPLLENGPQAFPLMMGKKNVTIIAAEGFGDMLPRYFEHFVSRFTANRDIVTITPFYNEILGYEIERRAGQELNGTLFDKMLREFLIQTCIQQGELFVQQNSQAIKGDIWKLYERREGIGYDSAIFDFTAFKKPQMKTEVKAYIKEVLNEKTRPLSYVQYDLAKLERGLCFCTTNYKDVHCTADINLLMVEDLRNHLQAQARTECGDKKLNVNTQAKVLQKCKAFVEFLMGATGLATPRPLKNPFVSITYHNLEAMEENTAPMPEKVVVQLLEHIEQLEAVWQRVLLISLNTGLRFKSIAYLDANCISFDEQEKVWKLEYVPWKILEARREIGLDDYDFIVVKSYLIEEIKDQICDTASLREEANTTKIFIEKTNHTIMSSISPISSGAFNKAVNYLIKKHHITDDFGNLWKFTHKQCRKTLAVDMITNGAKPEEVTALLQHLNPQTTNKYYNEVRKMKLSQMNSEFYRKAFNLLITEEQLSEYSEDQRQLLYVDFCENYREVELGSCIKPFGKGKCKRSGNESCATCKELCVSIDSLPKWGKMFSSQRTRLLELRKLYENEGILEDEYIQFREYQKEQYLYNAYKDVVDKIKVAIGNV